MLMDSAGILSFFVNSTFWTPLHDLGERLEAILILGCVFNFASLLGACHYNYYPVAVNVAYRATIFVVIGTLQMQSSHEDWSISVWSWIINAFCTTWTLFPRVMFVWEAREGLYRKEVEPESTASYSLIDNEFVPCEEV